MLAKIEERQKQTADGTLAEDEVDDVSEHDSDSLITNHCPKMKVVYIRI